MYAWRGLPASPVALERAIVRRYEHGRPLTSATFVYAGELLELDAPPAIRSALFQVMKLLPGVQDLGPATDRLGRHGIAVGLDTGGGAQRADLQPGHLQGAGIPAGGGATPAKRQQLR
jgi:hypothetical protein